jgi:penicillin-binding protein 2
MSIGQGDVLVTPLQICNATATIANGGKLFKPHLVTSVLKPGGDVLRQFTEIDNLVAKDVYSQDVLQAVREGMRQTVTSGSARSVFDLSFPIDVAAKTGTAQFGTEEKTHAWFTSYAPYDDPKIAITVIVEGAGEGFEHAAPVARDIYQWWAENRNK